MILGIELYKDEEPKSASIVPLAFPLVAGAASLAVIIAAADKYHIENVIVAILINLLVVYVVLKYSNQIEKMLGKQGITVLRKVFGIILLAIAVQMFLPNVRKIFNTPTKTIEF